MFKLTLVAICLVIGACSNEVSPDRTHRLLDISSYNDSTRGSAYVTDEIPVTIPNFPLMKVSVQRENENFWYTAFVEPDQAKKITKKGQKVKLYELRYYFSSTGGDQSLILARAE